MNRVELKRKARENLEGKWGLVIVAFIIMEIASGSGSLSYINPIFSALGLATILLLPVQVGYARFHYNIALGKEENIADLFFAFNGKEYGRTLIGVLLMYVYTVLWMLLFIIPGIIKAISYSMTVYILHDPDFENLTGDEAISKSRKMMDGHKMELFMIALSFIGWILLCGLTAGILLLYVGPYMQQTTTEFYLKLKNQN